MNHVVVDPVKMDLYAFVLKDACDEFFAVDVTEKEIRAAYEKYYKNEYFVRLLEPGVVPQTRWVEGSNFADVNFKLDPRTKRVVMMGAIDNMVKGAAGQAVQNMNLMFGLPENTGLKQVPLFP